MCVPNRGRKGNGVVDRRSRSACAQLRIASDIAPAIVAGAAADGEVVGRVFLGHIASDECKVCDWDCVGMWSRGVAGAAIERPQRGERCIARRAIAARGEASPRASKKREIGKCLK